MAEVIQSYDPDVVSGREDRDIPQSDKELQELKRKFVKFKKGCFVCNAVRKDKRLRKRLHTSRYYNPHSKDTLRQIQQDCALQGVHFTYLSLQNHVRKHDPPINTTLGKALAKEIVKTKIQLEKKQLKAEVLERPEELWKQVIKDAKFEMESGNIKPTLENALKAAKDYTDFMAKQKDQNMKLATMIWEFSSGHDAGLLSGELDDYILEINGEKYDGARITETAESNSASRQDGSSSVHNGDAGDATTQWPSTLYQGNSKKTS